MDKTYRPWPALIALVIGFFMILLDSTILSVANPAIMRDLGLNDYASVIWVTSSYLLATAVPLLITGRLGDRFGPKTIYLYGLSVFTLASAACGLAGFVGSGGLGLLIGARVVQGIGGAMMTPQTMAIITRTFPPHRRGPALGLWGAVAGFASLVGPILGGLLVDTWGWEWIFLVNLPIGAIGLVAAALLVPRLPRHHHSFDLLGTALSAAGLFLVIFAIQEGERYHWGQIAGPFTVWGLIGAGVGLLALFVWQQARNRGEPLLPLRLFKDRNFSLAAVATSTVGFAVTSMTLPMMFYLQTVRGLSPTESALVIAPSAVVSLVGAPLVGRVVSARNSRAIGFGSLVLLAASLIWMGAIWSPTVPIAWLLVPSAAIGLANCGLWSPLSLTATRDLAPSDAGAGAGVYNTTRSLGAVLGSASIAAMMQWRVSATVPGTQHDALAGGESRYGSQLPEALRGAFTTALAQSLLLPALIALAGAAIVLFFRSRPSLLPDSTWAAFQAPPGRAHIPPRDEPKANTAPPGRPPIPKSRKSADRL